MHAIRRHRGGVSTVLLRTKCRPRILQLCLYQKALLTALRTAGYPQVDTTRHRLHDGARASPATPADGGPRVLLKAAGANSHAAPTTPADDAAGDVPVRELLQEPRPKGFVGYIIFRYTWYITRLQRSLESEMPSTFHMFRVFGVGLKSFVRDFTDYVQLLVLLSFPSQHLEGLTLRQLELYRFMPRDMARVFPVLLVSAIPLGQNVALPLGYMFPRHLLCRHFWDLQQTYEFSMTDLRRRLYNARPLFRCVQAAVGGIPEMADRVRVQSACHQLGSGVHPRTEELLALRPLFAGAPFSLQHIKASHVNALLRLHGLSALPGGRGRLRDYGRWLWCHDRALVAGEKEEPVPDSLTGGAPKLALLGDLAALQVTTLKASLLLRGINPLSLDGSAMQELLLRWLSVSLQLQQSDCSLLLHLPLLHFYNHPTNLTLIAS